MEYRGCRVDIKNASGSTVAGKDWNTLASTSRNTWNSVDSGWITAPASASYARVELITWGGSPANPTRFDDMSVIEQGSTVTVPVLETPVLEDVSITYMPKTTILYQQ